MADLIIFMEKGSVKWSGNVENFFLMPYAMNSILRGRNDMSCEQEVESSTVGSMSSISDVTSEIDPIEKYEEIQDFADKEQRQVGKVKPMVYK